MTLTQYKKIIKSMSRDELESHLYDLFKTSKVFKDIESSSWSEEFNKELLVALEKRLDRVFWKENFSMAECKAVLKDFLSRTVNPATQALMHLAFASEAAKLSATFGDFGDAFYNSLESSAEKFLKYAYTDPNFFSLHENEFEKLITTASPLGYGISDDLEEMLEDLREDLGYYNDDNY